MRARTKIQKKWRAQTKQVTMVLHMCMRRPHPKKPRPLQRCDTVVFTRIPCYVACATRDAVSNSHKFARIRIRPEFARIRRPLQTRIGNFKFESSMIRLIASIGTYSLPSRLQFTCSHMGMPLPSTIWHKRFPKSFRNLAIFVVCCCLDLPC